MCNWSTVVTNGIPFTPVDHCDMSYLHSNPQRHLVLCSRPLWMCHWSTVVPNGIPFPSVDHCDTSCVHSSQLHCSNDVTVIPNDIKLFAVDYCGCFIGLQ